MYVVGICGLDVYYWKKGRIGDFIFIVFMVFGYELSGVVFVVGEGVIYFKVG